MFEYKFSTRKTRPVNMNAGAKMIFQIDECTTEGWRLAVQRRLNIGGIQISEGRRLVGFEFEARRGTIGGIQISEGLRLVEFPIPLLVPII